MQIKQAEFITSIADPINVKVPPLPEIAMVGKSNVGKSSLINSLTNHGKLAKTSATPGKTRLINYFRVNGIFYLVDLPGYGYAVVSKGEQKRWEQMMQSYFAQAEQLRHVFLLVDARHSPGVHDQMMCQWLRAYQIPFTIVATKCDKLPRSQMQRHIMEIAFTLQLDFADDIIQHATPTRQGRDKLLTRIQQVMDV